MSPATFTVSESMQRVRNLCSALHGDEVLNHPEWLRFVAQAALACPLKADEIAGGYREQLMELHQHSSWSDALRSPLRFAIAANLVIDQLPTAAFVGKVHRSRKLFHGAMICRDDLAELSSILILHVLGGQIDQQRIQFLARVHDCMHVAHIGHDDAREMPASALLTNCSGSAEDIVDRVGKILEELGQIGAVRDSRLPSTAAVLALTDLYAKDAVKRYMVLAQAVDRKVGSECRESIALLSLLDHDAGTIARRFAEARDGARGLCVGAPGEVIAALAADIAFLDLVRFDKYGRRITSGPDFEEMQRLIRRQRAMAIALARSTVESSTRTDIDWLISRYLSA